MVSPTACLLKALNVTKASQCPSSVIAGAQQGFPAPKLTSLRQMKKMEDIAEQTVRLFPRMKEECEKSLPKIDRFQRRMPRCKDTKTTEQIDALEKQAVEEEDCVQSSGTR